MTVTPDPRNSPTSAAPTEPVALSWENADEDIRIDDFLNDVIDLGGSDLHLSADSHPYVRVNRNLTR